MTGASSGIGRAVARRLLDVGACVSLWGRRRDRLVELASQYPTQASITVVDMLDERATLAAYQSSDAELGGIDLLVNAAGFGKASPLIDGDADVWRAMFEVNVIALSICTREAVRSIRERGASGHIVHVSSLSGHRVVGGGGIYAATKFAVRALTEGLRQELRRADLPIRVTSVSPGFVETDFHRGYFSSEERAQALYQSMKVLEPEDVADAVLYALASPPHVEVHDILLRSSEQVS